MCRRPSEYRLPASLLEETSWWRGFFGNPARPELLGVQGEESCHDVLDGGVLHLDVLGGPECLFALLMWKRFWTGVPKKTLVLSASYSLG
jgi:hypothetical protein